MSANFSLFSHLTQTVLYTALSIEACELEKLHLLQHEFNPLNVELNPICHLLALLGAHHILHISRVRVNVLPYNM